MESVHSGKPLSSTQLCSQKSICFADPREKVQKVFELYLQKNVHHSVWKCQGRCGKRIIIKDGQIKWTDKMTGKEMSCVGPMYMHFNQNCLEQFDTENFYGPVKRFDFSFGLFQFYFWLVWLVFGCFGSYWVILTCYRSPFASFWLAFGSFKVVLARFRPPFGSFWVVLACFGSSDSFWIVLGCFGTF